MELVPYAEAPRKARQAVVRELTGRVLDIVVEHHPAPVLAAEVEARITEETPSVDVDDATVLLSGSSVSFASEKLMQRGSIVFGLRGTQPIYRLPEGPVEARHITL